MANIIVVKRDGREELFNKTKIINAVLSAFKEVDGKITDYAINKASNIANYIYDYCNEQWETNQEKVSIETISDLTEKGLMALKKKDVAKAYILYRKDRARERERNSKIVQAVSRRNSAEAIENSNANVDERSFSGREKEASSDIQKIIALDYVLSKEVAQAHRDMLLYQHDLEKTNIGQHNCFERKTSFITDKGVKTFEDFCDGEEITILSPKGYWTKGTVRKYGYQKLNSYKIKKNKMEVIIRATANHRWINLDGDFQEGLEIEDKLLDPPFHWKDFNFEELSEEGKRYWCYGFVLGDGTLETRWSKRMKQYLKPGCSKVKLCGEKAKFLPYFQQCGWGLKCSAKEPEVSGIPFNKTIPNFDALPLEYLIAFIHGLYEADGTKSIMSNGTKQIYSIQSSNKEICDFIEKYFSNAGLYIVSMRNLTGQKTNFGIRGYTKAYQFQGECSNKYHWTVKSIIPGEREEEVWCLDVPDGHAFVLNYGIPTGNCLNIDFKKLLSEGFTTRNGDIRPPSSFSSACQLVAVIFQCQSQVQFGGVGSVHIDYDLAPYVRKSFAKHYKDGLKYICNIEENQIDYEIENMLINTTDWSIEDNEYQVYQPKAYTYAMDMLEREGRQATEALYHNLNTLESRAGSQVPFTSLNTGRDTSIEGRMVTRWLLEASIHGIGKHHLTPIFPISIFQYKSGVNAEPGTENYDLKQLALQSLSRRIYPNFVNCDWSQAHENPDDIDSMFSTINTVA